MPGFEFNLEGHTLAAVHRDPELRSRFESRLPAFLLQQRWFAGRAGGLQSATIEHALPLDAAGSLVLFVVHTTDDAGLETRYQVPLQATGADTVEDPLATEAAAQLRDILVQGRMVETEGVRLAATPIATGIACGGAPRLLSGEQSNTSVVFGRECILKFFRILQDGFNPDVQLVSWLSSQGGFPGVPRVIASARFQAPGLDADAAVLQEFLPNDGDGWTWTLAHARRAFAAVSDPGEMAGHLRHEAETLSEAAAIGWLTAQLHAALARATGPAMEPQPATAADWQAWHAGLTSEARATARMLKSGHPAAAARIAALADSPVPPVPGELGLKMRTHGDYHLGQLLHTERGWVVLDFEGEPSRPIAERIALQHPLVDVAGMLRSWDYAARVAGEDSPAVPAWRETVSAAFLDAYWAGADGPPRPFLPAAPGDRDALLHHFLLRKALYEVRYELGSRPAWVATPLAAVVAMLDSTT